MQKRLRNKMIKPKSHLSAIYRTPPDRLNRSDYLRLDKNEPIAEIDADLMQEIIQNITLDFLSTYPITYQLYEKLSKNIGFSEEHILITAGSDAAIRAVFDTFVGVGDDIVMINPTFAMYEVYGNLYQANITKVDYDNELNIPVEKLLRAITEKTKLIAIANPNSPTGTIMAESDILNILDRAKEVGAVVIVDEAYYYFYPETVVDYVDDYENLIVTRTFSKAFGLASIRLGFAVAHPDTIELLAKFRPMYEVNSFAVLFGCAVLDNMEIVEKIVQKSMAGKKYIVNEMNKLGYYTHPTYGNFLLIYVGGKHAESLAKYMFENGIIIKGGFSHKSLKQYIRISLGDVPQMKQVVECIERYMRGR